MKALLAISRSRDEADLALPTVTKLLKDPDPGVEAHAASCILTVDPDRIDAAKTLTFLLRHKELAIRDEAALAAGQAGPAAMPLIKELITTLQGDIAPKVRNRAAWALGQIGPDAKDAIPTLLDALKKAHPLQDYHGRGVDGLDDTIHQTCIVSLGEIGSGSAQVCTVLTSLAADDQKPLLQKEALKTLAIMKTGASSAVPALATQLEEAKTSGRKVALINILKNMDVSAAQALPQLNASMESKDALVRRAALDAILVIDKNEKNKQILLAKAVNDPDQQIKETAAEALAKSTEGAPDSLNNLIEGAHNGTPDARVASIKGLAKYGALAAEALPMLIKDNLGGSFVPQQRKAAFEAIKKIDPTGQKTIPLLRDNTRDAFKVRAAIELLEYLGSPPCEKLAKSLRSQWHM